jgi:hypothetical protein
MWIIPIQGNKSLKNAKGNIIVHNIKCKFRRGF